jgi:uncharacterized damage-inducible protein DinB
LAAEDAARRPGPGRPSPWALALHCAYWKHRVIQRVTGERRTFPRAGRNFPELPVERDAAAWRADRDLLDETHGALLATVDALDPADLDRSPRGGKRTRATHLRGIACHDVYHAGQIRLARRLRERVPAPAPLVRTWRGSTRAGDADAYVRYLRETGLAAYRSTEGNRGASILRRLDGARAHFLLVSEWQGIEAVKAFAGDDPTRAVFYPEDDRFLVDREHTVEHWEVVDGGALGAGGA